MKKQIFWKVIASLIVVWLFLFLWMNRWHYLGDGTFKTSKITGKIYRMTEGKGNNTLKWQDITKRWEKKEWQ
jgi:hypothetical protein